jgi:DNA-binding MarR family transcriptional regulator
VLECELYAQYDGGDHVILVGRVAHIEKDAGRNPLVFFRADTIPSAAKRPKRRRPPMPCKLMLIARSMPISSVVSKSGVRKRKRAGETPALTISRPELQIDGSDREFRGFVHGMLAFAARLEAVRSGFASLIGLTGIQYTILISVQHLQDQGDVSVSMIAEHLHVSGAFVTTETGKLLKFGLLTKRQDPQDGRRVCLRITRKGRDLLKRLAPTQVQVNDVLFEFMDGSEFKQFRAMVDRMAACGDRAVDLLDYCSRGGRSWHRTGRL